MDYQYGQVSVEILLHGMTTSISLSRLRCPQFCTLKSTIWQISDFLPQRITRPQSPTSPLTSPSRLSNLYQYHNAPEVAPGHGLEYDDTIYPSSDKCTVVNHRSRRPQYDSKLGYDPASKPPRIIFGMKVRTFIIVAILFVCILVGAAVGGAVGGKNMRGGVTANTIPLGEST